MEMESDREKKGDHVRSNMLQFERLQHDTCFARQNTGQKWLFVICEKKTKIVKLRAQKKKKDQLV